MIKPEWHPTQDATVSVAHLLEFSSNRYCPPTAHAPFHRHMCLKRSLSRREDSNCVPALAKSNPTITPSLPVASATPTFPKSPTNSQYPLEMASQIGRRLIPLLDRVLVERFVPQTVTKGGIVLPEKAQSKVASGTVVSTGPGRLDDKGQPLPVSVKPGDKVLLPEYGGTKVEIDSKEFFIFRDSEIIGKWE